MEIQEYVDKIAALEADLTASQQAVANKQQLLDAATSEKEQLKTQNAELVTELQNVKGTLAEADGEIARLSQELSNTKQVAVAGVLSVTVKKKRYTTPPGRTYQIDGVSIKAEDLVKDLGICETLVAMGSGILTEAQ